MRGGRTDATTSRPDCDEARPGGRWTGPGWTSALSRSRVRTVLGTPNRDRQTERREATRREILDAAWALAREQGLSQITLRQVADRVGMRAPSLYSHFASKNAIYDAMFAQAWTECLGRHAAGGIAPRARTPRVGAPALRPRPSSTSPSADLARHQLMNQRTIPGFDADRGGLRPRRSRARALRERLAASASPASRTSTCTSRSSAGSSTPSWPTTPAVTAGRRLLDRAVDMYADDLRSVTTADTRERT